jgi:hypothetical protein
MIYQQTRRWLDAGCFEIMVDEDCVELAYVDQRYTGEHAAQAAEKHGIRLEVVGDFL